MARHERSPPAPGRPRRQGGDPRRRRALTYAELAAAAAAVAERSPAPTRVAVIAENALETCVAVVGALAAGRADRADQPEGRRARARAHPVRQRARDRARRAGAELPAALRAPRVDVDAGRARRVRRPSRPTRRRRSSSTRRARPARRRASCCRAGRSPRTSTRWPTPGSGRATTSSPTALPLFHVHGLILGVLGPLRRGGGALAPRAASRRRPRRRRSSGRRDDAVRRADDVPPARGRRRARTRHRARAGGARLLVSGSAALPAADHERIEAADRAADRRALRDDRDADEHRGPRRRRAPARAPSARRCPASSCGWSTTTATCSTSSDDETIGEIQVRGPNLFLEYLNRPDATAEALRDGWFATGDVATRAARRLHPHRRPPRDRPDQERRLQDRRRRDRERAARAPRRRRGGGHRRARRRPRRADRRLGRPRRRRAARRAGAGRPRRPAAHAAQAPARGPLPRRAAAQRHGQGRQGTRG